MRLKIIEPPPKEWTPKEWETLQRDERYLALWQTCRNRELLVRAGFIEEPGCLRTSNQKMPVLGKGRLLLLTGCFAPIHDGHLAAMRQAKESVEHATSEKVVAGFFGFCHDKYVREKTKKGYEISERLRYFNASAQEPWMFPYLWETEQEAQTNFTTVWASLQSNYPYHAISLVYGSDNTSFGWVSKPHEVHVCVHRKGSLGAKASSCGLGRTLHVQSAHPDLSSTKIRAQ